MTSPTSGASFLLALAIGCGDAPASVPPERMTTGAEDTTGGSSDGTTAVPGPDACEVTEDCEGGFCVAPYDAGASLRGAAACVSTCVGQDDLALWCLDDAACCEGLSCNAVDGFCVGAGATSSSSSGTDGSSSSSGTGSEGGATEPSTSSSSTTEEAT